MAAKRISVIVVLLLWGSLATAADETAGSAAEPAQVATSRPGPATGDLPLTNDAYAPVLVVEGGLLRDFGEAEKGDVEHAQFVIRNDGPETLRILDVKADCGCLAPQVTRKELAKGERGTIEVKVVTSIIEGTAENKHIIVSSNDPRYPHGLQLQVTGTVVSTVGIRPERVVFDGVRPESGEVRVLEVYDLRNIGFRVTGVKTSTPGLAVKVEEAQVTVKERKRKIEEQGKEATEEASAGEGDGNTEAKKEGETDEQVEEVEKTYRGYRIEVRLTELAQAGRNLEEVLYIQTDYERRPVWPVQVVGSLVGDFWFEPQGTLFLGSTQMGKTTRAGMAIVIKGLVEGFAVSRAETTDPALTTEIEREGDTTRVRVRAKGMGYAGRHPGPEELPPLVLVYQEGKENPIIRMPVTWRVRGGGLAPEALEGEME